MTQRTYLAARQLIRNKHLNEIAKIYHPLYDFPFDSYSDMSRQEQKNHAVSCIISKMAQSLYDLKMKYNKSKKKESATNNKKL